MDWYSAKTACDELILNGYSDWYLPSKEELNALYVNLKKIGVGGLEGKTYWSSSEYSDSNAWTFNGDASYYNKNWTQDVRAVRAF
jgi:hypothetical protein